MTSQDRAGSPPGTPPKQPLPVGDGKIFPGKAHKLNTNPESEHSSNEHKGYPGHPSSNKSPSSGELGKIFPGKKYTLGDETPEPVDVESDTAPPSPRATRVTWVPPAETPSSKPPKRRFPSLGLRKAIKSVLPGRRTSKAKDEKAAPDTARPPDPEFETEMSEASSESHSSNKPLFPGKPRRLNEPEAPLSPPTSGSPRASGSLHAPGSPAGSHHPAPVESIVDEPGKKKVFPGAPRKLGPTPLEDAAGGERRPHESLEPGNPMFGATARKTLRFGKFQIALAKKQKGIRPPDRPVPSLPMPTSQSDSDSDSDYSDAPREKKKKFPGKAYRLSDNA